MPGDHVQAVQPATAEKESTMTASRRAALLLLMSLPVAAQAQASTARAERQCRRAVHTPAD
jgi:hypothetical protein